MNFMLLFLQKYANLNPDKARDMQDQERVSFLSGHGLWSVPVTDSATCVFSQMFHHKQQPGNKTKQIPFALLGASGVYFIKLCECTFLCKAVL